MKKLLPILIVSFFFLSLSLILPKSAHASGTLYFSPASGTKYNGQNFTVSVRASGMDNVDGVKAVLTYPTDKLTFVSISSSSSAWGIKAQETNSGSTIEIDRGNIGNLSGDKLVASITFRPKVNTGIAALTFTADSALTLAGSNVLGGKSNASFTLADAPAAPAAPVADKTPPTISAVKVTGISVNAASITWTTNEASDSSVDYGLSSTYILTASNASLVTTHSVALSPSFLEPGTTYHFLVRSKDAAGNEAKGSDQSLTTLGYDIKVTVTDSGNQAIAKTKVTLHPSDAVGTTDNNGVVTFKNVTIGEHVLTVNTNGQDLAATINVKNAGAKLVAGSYKTDLQAFTVKLAASSASFTLLQTASLVAAGILSVVLIGVVVYFLMLRRKKTSTVV